MAKQVDKETKLETNLKSPLFQAVQPLFHGGRSLNLHDAVVIPESEALKGTFLKYFAPVDGPAKAIYQKWLDKNKKAVKTEPVAPALPLVMPEPVKQEDAISGPAEPQTLSQMAVNSPQVLQMQAMHKYTGN